MLVILFASAFRFLPVGVKREDSNMILNFSDVRVAYIGYDTSWTAAKVEKAITATVEESGLKVAYMVSDEASTLKCAAKIANIPHLPDISHLLGTCLRKTYEKNEAYKNLLSLLSSYKSKGVNQDLTALLPPTQRIKARFMNQKAIVTWANTLLSKYDTLNEKEKVFFKDLSLHQPIIKSLSSCLMVAEFVGLNYKKQGICLESNQVMSDYLANIVLVDEQQKMFINFLIKYVKDYIEKLTAIYEKSGLEIDKQLICSLNPCTDILESMFGKYKNAVSSNPLVGVPTTCLELPLCYMDVQQLTAQIIPSIEEVFVADISAWKQGQSIQSQAIRRREFFKNKHKKSKI